MARDSSATPREETPHETHSTNNITSSTARSRKQEQEAGQNKLLNLNGRSKTTNGTPKTTISKALKRRAQSLLKDRSIDAQSRAVICYGLETNDPWLAELVRRADAGETIIDSRGLFAITRDQRRRFKQRRD